MSRAIAFNLEQMKALPEQLPDGCRLKMEVHYNFGDGGAATYSTWLPGPSEEKPLGAELPVSKQYDTRQPKPGRPAHGKRKTVDAFEPWPTGFFFADDGEGARPMLTWAEVREKWPAWRAARIAEMEAQDSQGATPLLMTP